MAADADDWQMLSPPESAPMRKDGVVSIDNSNNNIGQVVHVTNNYFINTSATGNSNPEVTKIV